MADEFAVTNHNFRNMTEALITCGAEHANGTLPYYQCLCSGMQTRRFIRLKYYYCKEANKLEEAASAAAMAKVGETAGIVLGVIVLLALIVFLYKRFRVQIRTGFAHLGLKQHYDSCTRMFCVCCQKNPGSRLDEPPATQNLAGRPTRWGRCCYSDTFLAIMEFICDCDCFRTRRAPKHIIPILGKAKPRRPASAESEEPMVELQPPRRMRSVRKAPPPPVPAPLAPAPASAPPTLPDVPGFDPELRSKRHAPLPPLAPGYQPYQPAQQPYQPPQSEQQRYQPYQPEQQRYQPYQPEQQSCQSDADMPPRYQDLHLTRGANESLSRGDPLRVSKEFTAQLNQAMAGRRQPSESDL